MDLMGVAKQENFGLTTDGACEADRAVGQEKNKNLSLIVLAYLHLPSIPSKSRRRMPRAGLRLLQCSHEWFEKGEVWRASGDAFSCHADLVVQRSCMSDQSRLRRDGRKLDSSACCR